MSPDPNLALDDAMGRYADGDEAAFAGVFRGLSPRIRAFLLRLSGRVDVADDLTQETFLRMHRARGSFARGRSVLPWAYAIARNCYIDHARSKAKVTFSPSDISELEVAAGPDACAEELVAAKQSAHTVERVLAEMTVARREAFVLLRYEGLSVEAAAQVLGISEGAVKLRAFHAYELLRAAEEPRRRGGGVVTEPPDFSDIPDLRRSPIPSPRSEQRIRRRARCASTLGRPIAHAHNDGAWRRWRSRWAGSAHT
ncbi:MAG: RNA polymerase sigma factor [Polyangiaceae bacterium]